MKHIIIKNTKLCDWWDINTPNIINWYWTLGWTGYRCQKTSNEFKLCNFKHEHGDMVGVGYHFKSAFNELVKRGNWRQDARANLRFSSFKQGAKYMYKAFYWHSLFYGWKKSLILNLKKTNTNLRNKRCYFLNINKCEWQQFRMYERIQTISYLVNSMQNIATI